MLPPNRSVLNNVLRMRMRPALNHPILSMQYRGYTICELLNALLIFRSEFCRKHLAIPNDTESNKPIIFQKVIRAVFNLVKYECRKNIQNS